MKTKLTSSSPRNKSCKPVCFINKGNTCYANSIIQALSTVPILWSRLPLESSITSPISRSTTFNVSFDFNSHQDAVEVLQVVLDDFKGTLVLANDLVSNALRTTITCNTCLCSVAKEGKYDTLPLPISNKIKTSFDNLLGSETLSSENKWFCPFCDTLTESTRETSITNFLDHTAIKDEQFFGSFSNSVFKVLITFETISKDSLELWFYWLLS